MKRHYRLCDLVDSLNLTAEELAARLEFRDLKRAMIRVQLPHDPALTQRCWLEPTLIECSRLGLLDPKRVRSM